MYVCCALTLQLKYVPIPLADKEGYPMTRIQFGWSLASGPREGMSRNAYMVDVQRGFELMKGHFDSFWFVDDLQSDIVPLLEGWKVLTYFAVLHPDVRFGNL